MSRSEQILRDICVDLVQSPPRAKLDSGAPMRSPKIINSIVTDLAPRAEINRARAQTVINHVRVLAMMDVTIGKPGRPGVHGKRTEKFLRALIEFATARTTGQIKKADAKVAKARDALLASMTPEVG